MNTTLSLVVVGSIAALRATPGAAGTVVAASRASIVQLYSWDAASVAPDDGINVVTPNPAVAGRWILRATLDNGAIQPALVMSVAWDGAKTAVLLAEGWEIIGADATKLYLARKVDS